MKEECQKEREVKELNERIIEINECVDGLKMVKKEMGWKRMDKHQANFHTTM